MAFNAHMSVRWTFLENNIALLEEDTRISEEDLDDALEKAFLCILWDAVPSSKVTNTWSKEVKRRVGFVVSLYDGDYELVGAILYREWIFWDWREVCSD